MRCSGIVTTWALLRLREFAELGSVALPMSIRSLLMFCLLLVSSCSADPSVGCFYVEVSPGKMVPVKFDSKFRTHMKIRYEGKTVVFELPWGLNSAQSLMEFEGKLYVLSLDATSSDRSEWRYRCFRQDGEKFSEIDAKEFPRSIAIFNIWRPGDRSRYSTGIGGITIDAIKINQMLDPEDPYFVNSYQARLWHMLEVTNSLHRAERDFGGDDGKKFLHEYIAKYKPVHLTSMELKPVPKEESKF